MEHTRASACVCMQSNLESLAVTPLWQAFRRGVIDATQAGLILAWWHERGGDCRVGALRRRSRQGHGGQTSLKCPHLCGGALHAALHTVHDTVPLRRREFADAGMCDVAIAPRGMYRMPARTRENTCNCCAQVSVEMRNDSHGTLVCSLLYSEQLGIFMEAAHNQEKGLFTI